MSDIKTPLTRNDALVLALNCAPSVDADDVADALMAVDVASRESNEALLVTCHRALLTVNEWLLSAYTDDKPIHPGAHRLLAEAVQAVLDRFKAEGRA